MKFIITWKDLGKIEIKTFNEMKFLLSFSLFSFRMNKTKLVESLYNNNMDEEIYCMDIDSKKENLLFGGSSNSLFLTKFPSLNILHVLSDYNDSVIFCKFLTDDVFAVATLDGLIELNGIIDDDILPGANRFLDEDITFIDYEEGVFLIGTSKGSLHIMNGDLEEEIMFYGHSSEIVMMKIYKNFLISLSKNKLIVHDLKSEALLHKKKIEEFITFYQLSDEYLIIGHIDKTIILKNYEEIFREYNFGAETVLIKDNYILIGGKGSSIVVIDSKTFQIVHKLDFTANAVTGLCKIMDLQAEMIIFGTFCGKLAIGKYRGNKNFSFYEGDVGVIYDFKVINNHVLVGGSEGIKIIDF